MTHGGEDRAGSSHLRPGLYQRLVDLGLAGELRALAAIGLPAALDDVDAAGLPARIAEVAADWITRALTDIDAEDRAAAIELLTEDLMALINSTATEPLLIPDDALAHPLRELNGPRYVGRVIVTGSDPYDLDRDNDGIGCE